LKPARTATLAIALAALCLLARGGTLAEAAQPPLLWQLPEAGLASGAGAGEFDNPRSIAADPVSGDVYVVDLNNARVEEFNVWGAFIRAFGWGVRDGAAELQSCTALSGCQAGTKGAGAGQLGVATAITIDANHDLYVGDKSNNRVEKFDSEGHFLLMFGGEVDKTTHADVCTQADLEGGDVCGAGIAGTGNGQFSSTEAFGSYLASGPGGAIYVGDLGRIEKFGAGGEYLGSIEGAELAGRVVEALAVDPAGDPYVILPRRFMPDEPAELLKLGPTGEKLLTFPVETPEHAIALGSGGTLYAVSNPGAVEVGTVGLEPRVVEFDAAGNKLIPNAEEEEAEAQEPPEPLPFAQAPELGSDFSINGLATSGACGIEGADLYVSYFRASSSISNSLLRAYGPHPDPTLCPPPERAPEIADQYASAVSTDSATVKAKISSNFWPTTTYYVEWGTGKCSEGGCANQQPAAPGTQLESETNLPVATMGLILSGLEPGTTYHYRFVARTRFQPGSGEVAEVKGVGGKPGEEGAEGTFTTPPLALAPRTDCANQAFRSGASATLPDCRAYEMVSPLDKEGADLVALNDITGYRASLDQSAALGDRMTYSAYRAFAGAVAAPYTSQYMAVRTERGLLGEGWASEQVSPPRGRSLSNAGFTNETEYRAFSADLCQGWLVLDFAAEPPLDPAEVPGYRNVFRRDNCAPAAGGYEALTTVTPAKAPENFLAELQGTSADGAEAIFTATDPLATGAPANAAASLFEQSPAGLRYVCLLPSGKAVAGDCHAGSFGGTDRQNSLSHALSADGSRVFFSDESEGQLYEGRLYLRLHSDRAPAASGKCAAAEPEAACTVAVSSGAAYFWGASKDGSRAIYEEKEAGKGTGKLFEFTVKIEAGLPVRKATPIAEGSEGLLGISEDASRIYFASTKVLSPGEANGHGEQAVAGRPNLYYSEAGQGPVFIGTLAGSDVLSESENFAPIAIVREPAFRGARVSPDGLYAAFLSHAPLTGFDSTDQASGAADDEVFLYDANTGKLICASCDPSGTRPAGRNSGSEVQPTWAAASIPGWENDLTASRPLSADGKRLFFDSYVPLVSRDANGKADVYEWESAQSQAACEEAGGERYVAESEGCLSLISSGESALDSEFIDAGASGSDVFFATASSLLAQDPGLIDVYDAREGGGFPPPPGPPPGCEGEACQGPPAPPNDPTPASAGLEGQGNVKPAARCPRGKVRRKGRCVKPHPGKHHNRKHAKKRSHR